MQVQAEQDLNRRMTTLEIQSPAPEQAGAPTESNPPEITPEIERMFKKFMKFMKKEDKDEFRMMKKQFHEDRHGKHGHHGFHGHYGHHGFHGHHGHFGHHGRFGPYNVHHKGPHGRTDYYGHKMHKFEKYWKNDNEERVPFDKSDFVRFMAMYNEHKKTKGSEDRNITTENESEGDFDVQKCKCAKKMRKWERRSEKHLARHKSRCCGVSTNYRENVPNAGEQIIQPADNTEAENNTAETEEAPRPATL